MPDLLDWLDRNLLFRKARIPLIGADYQIATIHQPLLPGDAGDTPVAKIQAAPFEIAFQTDVTITHVNLSLAATWADIDSGAIFGFFIFRNAPDQGGLNIASDQTMTLLSIIGKTGIAPSQTSPWIHSRSMTYGAYSGMKISGGQKLKFGWMKTAGSSVTGFCSVVINYMASEPRIIQKQ